MCSYYSQPDIGIIILCNVQFLCKAGRTLDHPSPPSFHVVQERRSCSLWPRPLLWAILSASWKQLPSDLATVSGFKAPVLFYLLVPTPCLLQTISPLRTSGSRGMCEFLSYFIQRQEALKVPPPGPLPLPGLAACRTRNTDSDVPE